MTITLTEAAAGQIRSQIAKRGTGIGLRVGVKNVGCSGLAYTYELADDARVGDRRFEDHGAVLLVDPQSFAVIDGSRLDFRTVDLKQSFEFDNPNADSTCGCGESFNLKAGAAASPR